MHDWLRQNSWTLIISALTMAAIWGSSSQRLDELELKIQAIANQQEQVNAISTRVSVLEANTVGVKEDVTEIKADIKDLKRAFKIEP